MDCYSFYYRDSLDLKKYYPGAYKISLLYPNSNVMIEDGVMSLRDPSNFLPSSINNIVRVYPHKYDYFTIEVSILCWKRNDYVLKEVTRYGKLKSYGFVVFLRRVLNKLFPRIKETLLFTSNDYSYFSKNNKLIKRKNGKNETLTCLPCTIDSIHYEFLPFDNEAFLRTGNRIYMSTNGLKNWKLIYEGKRAIKDSMIWIAEERALLYSEYSTGLGHERHHLYKYFIDSGETRVIMTFYSPEEHERDNSNPYCRHIHVLKRDPFSNDIYMGVGDSDDESAVYRSTDNGNTFTEIGHGSHLWRTLSFMFTENHVYWNTDSPDPQFINCLNRSIVNNRSLVSSEVMHYPLYGGACWNTIYDNNNNLYIMSANCEGALHGNKHRVYGIEMTENKPLTVYCLYEEDVDMSENFSKYFQLFVLGIDCDNRLWFYDKKRHYYRQFIVKKLLKTKI